jgi:hypothetical protein
MRKERLPLVGAEPFDASLDATNALRQSRLAGAAKSDAIDPSLQELIDAWPNLPQTIKAGILALVQATVGSDP